MLVFARRVLFLCLALAVFTSGCLSPDYVHAPPSVRIYDFDEPESVPPKVNDLWLDEDELEAVSVDSIEVDAFMEENVTTPYRRIAVLNVVISEEMSPAPDRQQRLMDRMGDIMKRAGHIIGADAVVYLKEDEMYRDDWAQRRQKKWDHSDVKRTHSFRALAIRYDDAEKGE